MPEFLNRLLDWFKGRPNLQKALIAAAIIIVLVLLSRLLANAAVVVFFVALGGVIVQAIRRHTVRPWLIVGAVAIASLFVFGNIADAVYGPAQTQDQARVDKPRTGGEMEKPDPRPPKLDVYTPRVDTTVSADHTSFKVEGTVTPATAEVRVNGSSVSSDDGSFVEWVYLDPGENKIYVTAENGSKHVGQTRVVTRKEAAEKPSEEALQEAAAEAESPESEPAPEPDPVPEPQNELTGLGQVVTMTRAVDGDTIEISPTVDGRTDIRLIGIDTPETSSDCGKQPLADAAERFTARFSGQKVALEFDEERIDPYDRLLAYVYLPSGSMLNEELVSKGLAQVATYPPNTRYESKFIQAQDAASIYARGIWGLGYEESLLLEDRGNGIGGGCEAQPEPPATATATAPATATATAEAGGVGLPPLPADGDYDCSHFGSQAQAQQVFNSDPSDPHGLDGSPEDGIACESLP